jgi:hypothetical protein
VVLEAIPGARTGSHHLSMGPCHRLSKEGLRTTGKGLNVPRGWPPLDHGLSPLSSHGRAWARHGSLLCGVMTQLC